MFSLKGKIAVVTGACGGIGKEIAKTLADAGAHIILTDKNIEKLNEIKRDIELGGGTTTAIQANMVNLNEIKNFFVEISSLFQKLDILINNAGTSVTKKALEITEDDWDFVLNVNLKGLFFMSQAAAKLMKESGGGKIINISSIMGSVGDRSLSPYVASKGGVIQLTKALALEWVEYGIQVNTVGPGYVQTNMNTDLIENNQKARIHMMNKIPMRRFGHAKEIASGVLYLCSEEASYITGQTLFIDGGVLAQ